MLFRLARVMVIAGLASINAMPRKLAIARFETIWDCVNSDQCCYRVVDQAWLNVGLSKFHRNTDSEWRPVESYAASSRMTREIQFNCRDTSKEAHEEEVTAIGWWRMICPPGHIAKLKSVPSHALGVLKRTIGKCKRDYEQKTLHVSTSEDNLVCLEILIPQKQASKPYNVEAWVGQALALSEANGALKYHKLSNHPK